MISCREGGQRNEEASMTAVGISSEDDYALTLHMKRRYQRTLKVAAMLAKEAGIIEEDAITELMNLFVNLGLDYIKSESLR
jgi:hypothetical protein